MGHNKKRPRIHWIPKLMKYLASEGRTVFVSSHLMNEMAVTADHLIVIGRGQLIASCPTAEFIGRSKHHSVLVRGADQVRIEQVISAGGGQVERGDDGALTVTGLEAPRIGELVAREGLVLHELTPQRASLEEAFMELTHDSVEYGAAVQAAPANNAVATVDSAGPR